MQGHLRAGSLFNVQEGFVCFWRLVTVLGLFAPMHLLDVRCVVILTKPCFEVLDAF